jgi:pyruvate/2-oxoglutarate/acetoin dehydrogenase E1 component
VDYKFVLGKADTLREGKDVTIISSGVMLTQCLEAAEVLANQGVQARVINMHTIKPIDADTVVRAAKETGAIITTPSSAASAAPSPRCSLSSAPARCTVSAFRTASVRSATAPICASAWASTRPISSTPH